VGFIRRKTEKAGATTVEVISSPGDGAPMHLIPDPQRAQGHEDAGRRRKNQACASITSFTQRERHGQNVSRIEHQNRFEVLQDK
jgi:hypothetical protein